MSTLTDIRNAVDPTPLYAAVGATDLVVERAREAGVRADKVRAELQAELTDLQADLEPARVQARAEKTLEQVKDLPALALNHSIGMASRVAESYEDLAARGESLLERMRNQQATRDLVAQAENTVSRSKAAVTTARNAMEQVERSAKATVTTGRKEAERAADVIADSVADETKTATTEVKKSAARTRTAAKRTSTTTKNAAKRTRSSAKGATTSARKTAKAAEKATEKAAEKVGD